MADVLAISWPPTLLALAFLVVGIVAWRDTRRYMEADRRADAKARGWEQLEQPPVFDLDFNDRAPADSSGRGA